MSEWCQPDGCPAEICGGPHVQYVNSTGDECLLPRGMSAPEGWWPAAEDDSREWRLGRPVA